MSPLASSTSCVNHAQTSSSSGCTPRVTAHPHPAGGGYGVPTMLSLKLDQLSALASTRSREKGSTDARGRTEVPVDRVEHPVGNRLRRSHRITTPEPAPLSPSVVTLTMDANRSRSRAMRHAPPLREMGTRGVDGQHITIRDVRLVAVHSQSAHSRARNRELQRHLVLDAHRSMDLVVELSPVELLLGPKAGDPMRQAVTRGGVVREPALSMPPPGQSTARPRSWWHQWTVRDP
jgi:hypothetical protein